MGPNGKQLPVEIQFLERPIPYVEIPFEIRVKSRVFNRNGTCNQGYFFPVSDELWDSIVRIGGENEQAPISRGTTQPASVRSPSLQFPSDMPTDVSRIVQGRTEQHLLRKLLVKGNSEAQCGICGRQFPASYLHAAHIKPRSKATEKERHDLENIAILACLFGCDAAFELGHIFGDSQGRLQISESAPTSIQKMFEGLQGRKLPSFTRRNKKYFDAHRALHN